MNLQQIIYFKTIAELEHYTRAAERLLISQPSLSYAMSELERELGAPLFQKSGRNVSLTRYGRLFLAHAERALQELKDGREEIKQLLYPDQGSIVISYPSSMGISFIPYIISCFYADGANKRISFTFEQHTTPETVKLFREGAIDIAFGSKTMDQDMVFHPIYAEKMVLVISRDHPMAGRRSVQLAEIAGEPLVTWNKGCASRPEIEALYKSAGLSPHIAFEVQDEAMITGIVSKGLGVGIVPQLLGQDYPNVAILEIENLNASRTMYMIWPKNRYISPVADRFREYVIQQMSDYQEQQPFHI